MKKLKLLSAISFSLLAVGLLYASAPVSAEDEKAVGSEIASSDTAPKEKVKVAIDEIIKVVESNPGDAKKTERRQKLRDLINPLFDFDEMAKRSLGVNWKEATPEEQQ